MPRQRALSEHARMQTHAVRDTIDAELRRSHSQRGVRLWWATRRHRLGMLTPAELLELGCYQTLFFECSRSTGSEPETSLRDLDLVKVLDLARRALQPVTDA